jgi:hypothetical protein
MCRMRYVLGHAMYRMRYLLGACDVQNDKLMEDAQNHIRWWVITDVSNNSIRVLIPSVIRLFNLKEFLKSWEKPRQNATCLVCLGDGIRKRPPAAGMPTNWPIFGSFYCMIDGWCLWVDCVIVIWAARVGPSFNTQSEIKIKMKRKLSQ